MRSLKKLLLVTMTSSLGSMVNGMEKESLLLQIPSELRQEIISLLLEKTLKYNYEFFRKIKVEKAPIWSIAFSPDGKTILTGSYDKTARLWDVETGDLLKEFINNSAVLSVAFSPDGKTILTGSLDKTARLWDVESGDMLKSFKNPTERIDLAVFSPDGKTILTVSTPITDDLFTSPVILPGDRERIAQLWNVASGKLLTQFSLGIGHVESVAFSPNGKIIATGFTGSYDKITRLWDIETGNQLKELAARYVKSLAFSPDGKTILTGSGYTAQLWDVETGKLLKEFKGHTLPIYSVAFSPDGKTILTGSYDKTARLWDRESGEQLKEFRGHTNLVTSVVFSNDGKMIATGSQDNTVIVYRLPQESSLTTKERFERLDPAVQKELL